MKTKLSKRILSVFLSALMVVTSIPFVTFTAFADEYDELESAMEAFDAKLAAEGAAYGNVEPAYEAYVNAQKAQDAYTYGGATKETLTAALNSLNNAMSQMTDFTGYKSTLRKDQVTSTDSADGENFANYYKNVLWVETGYNASRGSASGDYHGAALYYPQATMFYDGTNVAQSTVLIDGYGEGSTGIGTSKTRTMLSVAVTNTDGISLTENWIGCPGNNLDMNWTLRGDWNTNPSYLSYMTDGLNGAGTYNIRDGRTNRDYRFVNFLKFTGTMETTENIKEITPSVHVYMNSSSAWKADDGASLDITGDTPIRVINIKRLIDAIAENGGKMKGIDFDLYSEGGLSEFITAMDDATGFDPNTYFTTSNDYNACVDGITNAINAMNSAPTNNQDNEAYQNLRAAMDAKMTTWNNGVNSGYTEDSWSTFYNAYNNAKSFMSSLPSTGYVDPQRAQELADALNAENPVTNVSKADTSALEAIIDKFTGFSNIFTTETYDAVLQVVNNAKTAVWTSVEDYKNASKSLDDSEENDGIIAQQVTLIEEALKTLRIDPDTFVVTENGRYSLNSAVKLEDEAGDPHDYANYVVFETAVNDARNYILQMAAEEFTDYDTQYNAYIEKINAVVKAYYSLEHAFTNIPDGTIAQTPEYKSITQLNHDPDGGYNYWFDFRYPSSAIIFRTTHDAKTVDYGDAELTYALTSGSDANKDHNALDSITIEGTAEAAAGQLTSNGMGNGTPKELSQEQKTTYAGSLSHNGFSLTNFRVTETANDTLDHYGIDASGNHITEMVSPTDEYTKILATTEGLSSLNGTIPLKATKGGENASIKLTSDMNYDVPASEKQELSATTLPTSTTYSLTGTYFGATFAWSTQPSFAYAGYAYVTSKTNEEMLASTVTVLDVSYLIELCNKIEDEVAAESQKYTDDSWQQLSQALMEAEASLDYSTLSAATMLNRCRGRYTDLWNAYQNLKIKDLNVTFNYKDAQGSDTSSVITVKYGETLNDHLDEFNQIVPPSYSSEDGMTLYTFDTWSPEVQLEEPVVFESSYTAQYVESQNKADFTEYDLAKAALKGKLTDKTYTVKDLEALEAAVKQMTYFDMDEGAKGKLMGDSQPAINAEKDKINQLAEGLKAATLDDSAAEAAVQAAKAGKDEDVYDISGLDFEYTQSVSVCGESVLGLKYESQDELDAAISEVLNSLSKHQYTIYLNGRNVGTAEYGTPVIVDSNGTFTPNVDDTSKNDESCDMVAWSYSYAAPSRDNQQTESKYMLTAKSLGFVVKGDTYLTTAKAVASDEGHVVKFMTNDGKVFDIQYTTNGQVKMPAPPSYAYYKFTGYDNGQSAGDTINVTDDMVIVANYTPESKTTYTISYFDSLYGSWMDETTTDEKTVSYNTLVSFSNPDAYCWTIAQKDDLGNDKYVVVSYGTEYSFYACESFDYEADQKGLLAFSEEEYQAIVEYQTDPATGEHAEGTDDMQLLDANGDYILAEVDETMGTLTYKDPPPAVSVLENVVPIYDSSEKFEKFSMIGTFILPKEYSLIESGFLFSSNQDADLTVEKVGQDGIARMKASKHTCGNQFVVNVKAPTDGRVVTFKYAGYAIVKDAEGNLTTLYSKSVSTSTAGF